MNKVILIGRVGKDPETRATQKGGVVALFSVATSRFYKGQESTDWHDCVSYSKTAETVATNVRKGDLVAIDGQIQYRTYEKDGAKQKRSEIVAWGVQRLSSKASLGHGAESGAFDTPGAEPGDEEIPF